MAPLQFVRHEAISLRQHPEFSERWIQDIIAREPSILGLGDLELIERERSQERSGRLDFLMSDGDSTRYEVELMLGATDPSHLVRCIEYWDIERRKYPGYDHVAVLIAEDITSRFLNIISLMAGNIPMIAIQLSALKVGEHLVLNFITVLNQTSLRRDDEAEAVGQEVDRAYWDARAGQPIMRIADGLLAIANQYHGGGCQLRYLKQHCAISHSGDWHNLIALLPKKSYMHFTLYVQEPDQWVSRIEEQGLVVSRRRQSRIRITVNAQQFQQCQGLVTELIAVSKTSEDPN